ncbi:response regulator [Azospirillum agricola]|uniref:response regulator n=1 Tax=Azospirillum agricola TaxID=1720247 RepID=UPI000A0EF79A|nr:response regulator [Azospirillum agricola]SMH33408.1 Signal transduction histidine kinase [Azospirillum lipoferum]
MAIVLSAMMGNAALMVHRDYQDTVQRRYSMVRDMTRVVEEHVHRAIRGAAISLDQTAAMVAEAGGIDAVRDLDHWKRLREYAAHVDGGESIWLIDARGRAVLESTSFPGRPLTVPDRDYFRAAQESDRLFVGPAVIGRTPERRMVFTVSRPLRDQEGTFVGVAAVAMSVDYLTGFYDLLGFDFNPLIGVYRPDGTVVGRRPDMRDMVGRSVAGGLLFQSKLKEAPEGTYVSPSVLDGVSRFAAYRTMRDYGLIVLAGIEQTEALAEWRSRAVDTIVEALVGSLIILLTMGWGFRYLDRERRTQLQLVEARETAERAGAERDEVTRLAGELTRAKEAAEAANRGKGEFLASLSHELRTPLNAVIGFSDLIARESEGPVGVPVYRHFAANVRDSGQHLLELINEILDHAQAEAGNLRLVEGRVDLDAAATFAVRMLTPRAERAGVTLAVMVAPGARFLRGDERRLRQILLNLIANAVKYTPSGGSVTVTAGLEAGALEIRVIDTGFGIPPEDLERVMEPFGRVDSAVNRRVEGTGLGLPLTRRLVELHGGTLSLRSTLGVGTTVTARLPGARVLPVEPDKAEPGEMRPAPSRGDGPLTVLLVEDDPIIRMGTAELLREWGHAVVEAANANAALVVLTGKEPLDLLFTDVVMPPGMPGTELARHAQRLRPGLPVLLTSGFAAHAVGAGDGIGPEVAMIAKPYAPEDLRQHLARAAAVRAGRRKAAPEMAASGTTAEAPMTGAAPSAGPAGRAPRLLIAEDLEINRELLAAIFQQSGYGLDLVADGAAAVEAMRGGADYDLVLMDVHMPVMNGLEATRLIRAMPPPRGTVPILALTAGNMPEEIAECRRAGMDGHVGKPYDRARLLREAAKAIDDARTSASRV